ncbi:MAG: prolyl-tRNA synthetase associated domain-containing protein [Natronincolaceae bacterium]|jgi:Ala-tRNA(Pro) deacylase|nr:prolyl-tRNA synthetase associated domain-containing protein [Bacillota bacterium]NLK90365.1 prolyl-tRNA synthetase associated domain-containing protein [Clostridiales bacterium]
MEDDVYKTLKMLNISYDRFTHPAMNTIEELNKYNRGNDDIIHCKNLFLRNSKGDKHYLVLTEPDKRANIGGLARQIGSTRLSFASPERLEKYLGLDPGSVSPFGLINDKNKDVEVLIDRDLDIRQKITFHPNINTVSVTMSYEDFQRYIGWCGNKVIYVDVG